MIGADSFSSSYSEAREKFQEAVAAARGSAESFKHPRSGPGGEELAVDAAWFGPSDASRVLGSRLNKSTTRKQRRCRRKRGNFWRGGHIGLRCVESP